MRYAVLFTITKQYKLRYTHTYIYVTATATIHTHTDINNKIIRIIIKKKNNTNKQSKIQSGAQAFINLARNRNQALNK